MSALDLTNEDVLRMVVREEVQAGIAAALASPACPRPCEKVADLERATYGNGSTGIKSRVTTLEEQVANLVWLTRTALGAAIVAAVAALASVVG